MTHLQSSRGETPIAAAADDVFHNDHIERSSDGWLAIHGCRPVVPLSPHFSPTSSDLHLTISVIYSNFCAAAMASNRGICFTGGDGSRSISFIVFALGR